MRSCRPCARPIESVDPMPRAIFCVFANCGLSLPPIATPRHATTFHITSMMLQLKRGAKSASRLRWSPSCTRGFAERVSVVSDSARSYRLTTLTPRDVGVFCAGVPSTARFSPSPSPPRVSVFFAGVPSTARSSPCVSDMIRTPHIIARDPYTRSRPTVAASSTTSTMSSSSGLASALQRSFKPCCQLTSGLRPC